MKQCQEVNQNKTRRKTLMSHFMTTFTSVRETGHSALLAPIFEIFPMFPNFLRS